MELELTESALIDDLEFCADILQRIVDLGVRIAIDDFGTGYASYRHLQRLPIHTLKIDKAFTDQIPDNAKGTEVVKSMIYMCKALEMRATAEGVENAQQAVALSDFGCDLLQGYHFSKPVPASKIDSIVEKERAKKDNVLTFPVITQKTGFARAR